TPHPDSAAVTNLVPYVRTAAFFFSRRRRHTRWPRDWSSDVCSSDLLPHGHTFPHILGADGAGVVAAVGTEVRSVRLGDRVMLNPGISDYTCEYCRAGEHSLCVNYRMLGEHLPGTLCESVIVPEQNVAII